MKFMPEYQRRRLATPAVRSPHFGCRLGAACTRNMILCFYARGAHPLWHMPARQGGASTF
jgi:hypothetical protein